jgi:hypothetical protein
MHVFETRLTFRVRRNSRGDRIFGARGQIARARTAVPV